MVTERGEALRAHGEVSYVVPHLEALVAKDIAVRRFTLDGEAVTLAELVDANRFEPPDVDRVDALAVGEHLVLGGGAFAEFVLTRIR
jgi:hypothetical protein